MNRKPVIFADAFLVFLTKVVKEIDLNESEYVVIDRTDLFRDDDDLMNMARIQNALKEVYSKVSNDFLTGDQGVEMVRRQVIEPYRDLIIRLTESRRFPELYAFYHLCS